MQDTIIQPAEGRVLRFTGLLVVVGGGALDVDLLASLSAGGAALVGADGGGDAIAAAGLVPKAIIGDFDSLADPNGWTERTVLLPIAEQDSTDFEKVLYSTQAPLTVALGMTGRRFDHTLAALNAVARYGAERPIILVDEDDVALSLSGTFGLSIGEGERVSVYPLGQVAFRRSDGLRYPLDELVLEPDGRIGTSNQTISDVITIEPEGGNTAVYLLIVGRQHLGKIIEAVLGVEKKGA